MASKNPKATYMVSTTVSYSRDYYIDHIRGTLLCYCLCWFLSVSPPFFKRFLPNTCFIRQFTCFLRRVLSLLTSSCGIAWTVWKWVDVGGEVGWGHMGDVEACFGFTRKFMLARDLMRQLNAWLWVRVRLPVRQGTGVSSSTDNTWVQYSNRDWNLTVYPDLQMQTGFVHYCLHNSTQLCKYDQGFPP